MTPMRYVRNGVVCFTVGLVLLFIAGFSGASGFNAVLQVIGYLLWVTAAVMLVIAVIGAGVKAGRSD